MTSEEQKRHRVEQDVKLIEAMETIKLHLDERKNSEHYEGRAISIAITHLETAQLWFANSRNEI